MTSYCFLCHTRRDANGITTTILCRRCRERKKVDDYLLNFIGHTSQQKPLGDISFYTKQEITEFKHTVASGFADAHRHVKKESLRNNKLAAEGVSQLSQREIDPPKTIRDFNLWLLLQDQEAKQKDKEEQQKNQESLSREQDKAKRLLLQSVVQESTLFTRQETRAEAGSRKFETQRRMLLLSLSKSSTGRIPVPMLQSRAELLAQSSKTTRALPTVPKHGRMAVLHGS